MSPPDATAPDDPGPDGRDPYAAGPDGPDPYAAGPDGPAAPGAPDPSALPSPGRAFAVYSVLRLALLAVSYVVLRLILGPGNDLLVVGAAVLLSALLSLVLLREQRDAFTAASIARADARRAAKQSRRARLDEDGTGRP